MYILPTAVLSFYMRDVLLYDESQAIDICHVFMMLCYVSAIIGGIVGNSNFGKYKTILLFSTVYWIGILILFWTTIQQPNKSMNFMTLYSLILISIGMGGIKSCIAAFGVDQLIENDKNISESHVRAFFSTFYFTIHLGVFFGMFASPAITKIMAYGGYNINEYVLRFGLPAIMMTISISVFVCGNSFYLFKKPVANILPKMIKCICLAVWMKLTRCREKQRKTVHWLDRAEPAFSTSIINDTKKTLHMLCLYVPLSIFWSLFDQQNTTWIFQASRTSGRLFGMEFPVSMMQVVNPLLVLLTIPMMDHVIYPYLKNQRIFKYPLKRMLLGGGIAGVAFVLAGCIEMRLENNVENITIHNDHRYNVTSWYTEPCSANILWISNIGLQRLSKKQCFIVNNITIPKLIHENPVEIQVANSEKSKKKIKNNQELIRVRSKSNKNSTVLLVMRSQKNAFKGNCSYLNSPTFVLTPENEYKASEKTQLSIYVIFPVNNRDNISWLQIKSLTLKSKSSNMFTIFEKTLSTPQKFEILQIPIGLYTLTINYTDKNRQPESTNVLNLGTDKMFVYQGRSNGEKSSKCQAKRTLQPNVSTKWILPQFVCMTFGETLFTVTGLAFSFSEAPDSMKTVSISMWYFSVALGNLIVIFINKTILFEKKSNMFFMYAFNALLAIIITCKLSNVFEKLYYDDKKSETEKAINEENFDLG